MSSVALTYDGNEATTTWDMHKGQACLCESSWEVGFGSGQRQLSEFFGPGCQYRRCPSGDDPLTEDPDPTDTTDGNGVETDCQNKYQNGRARIQTVWTLPVTPVASKGYQWVANAATDSNCAASTDHVNTLTAYHEQLIGTSGTYGLCYANLNSNAATYVVRFPPL